MATSLFKKPRRRVPETPAESGARVRTGIIDIGSNSIRLVVYEGPRRLPSVLFNEKVMAGLGRSLSATGAIDADALKAAGAALARFAWLAREMDVAELRTVATAAVRDATNGEELLAEARALDLQVELLSGEEEAFASGMGVLSAFPDADGIVGDLGGGSLELVRVVAGAITDRVSFPLGVLRLGAIREKGKGMLERRVAKLVRDAGWKGRGKGLPLYLVGGSWRALARLDMHTTGYPLPVIHGYCMTREDITRLGRVISHSEKSKLKAISNLSSARVPTLGDAAALLGLILRELDSETTIASSYGLREGLLFTRLTHVDRAEDPLIVAAHDEGARMGRFAEHGDLLDQWLTPLFEQESAEHSRLRHAACLLADVGWRANPEFRAERGVEIALHGNWVAIDAAGRAMVAQALFTCLGGGVYSPAPIGSLAPAEDLEVAMRWGLAMRLGQRLSGGVAPPLERTRLMLRPDAVELSLAADDSALYGEAVERRHKALAAALAREPLLSRN